MSLFRLLFLFFIITNWSYGQNYYPVKVNQKWGLMNKDGNLSLAPKYDAIGEFEAYGYAVMQRDGGVGLFNKSGEEIIAPIYEDLRVLDSLLIAVMDQREWMVINLDGQIVLKKGYNRVHVWNGQYLAYLKDQKWGLASANGQTIASPSFDGIELIDGQYFQTIIEQKLGLLASNGKQILPAFYDEIRPFNDRLFFFKQDHKWGAANADGLEVIAPKFSSYQKISDNFIQLKEGNSSFLYSIIKEDIITNDEFSSFYAFTENLVLCKKQRKLGLIDVEGFEILPAIYNEIHAYSEDHFRVKKDDKWGVVRSGNVTVIPFQYDYIAPLNDQVCVVKKEHFFGIVNYLGEEVVTPKFTRIELEDNQAKAFAGEALSMFYFDEEGQLKDQNEFKKHFTIRFGKDQKRRIRRLGFGDQDDFMLEHFEWFYEPRVDKWGLRRIDNAEIQIQPTYDGIQIERELGFTIVFIEKQSYLRLDRTDFRFERVYGLVNNEVGMLTTLVNILDIRMRDFEEGLAAARIIFANGRHGLISRIGKIIQKDFAYIGEFKDGLARMSIKGKLSAELKVESRGIQIVKEYFDGFMNPHFMRSFTQYDQDLHQLGKLTCLNCNWGYLDTIGQIRVPTEYDFARDFKNEIGIVEFDNKWGVVNADAKVLVPCVYDEVDFLDKTDDQILQISLHRQKYGLIDTLGQVTVNLMYDQIGNYSEGRLAVKRGNKWGFVDEAGEEIIACQFNKIKNFSDGIAIVRKGTKWGAIDKRGNVLVDFKYNHLGNFKNGLSCFNGSYGKGYLNEIGDTIIIPQFQRANDFENGVARVAQDGKYGLINTQGEYILRPKYGDIKAFNEHGLAVVRYGKNNIRYGIINRQGKLISDKDYQEIRDFVEGYAIVRFKGKYGFIDTRANLVIPAIYSKASPFSEGRASVQLDGSCGYIDVQGKNIVHFEYTKCLDFKEGKAVVYKGYKKAGLIDVNGTYIIPPSLNRLVDFSEGRGLVRDNSYRFYYITEQARLYEGFYQQAGEFQNGVAVVKMDNKWGVINQKGIELIPPKYDRIEAFEDGYAKVQIKQFSGLTNLEGELIVQANYEYISYAGEGLFRVEQGDKIGYFDMNGQWIWDLQE